MGDEATHRWGRGYGGKVVFLSPVVIRDIAFRTIFWFFEEEECLQHVPGKFLIMIVAHDGMADANQGL